MSGLHIGCWNYSIRFSTCCALAISKTVCSMVLANLFIINRRLSSSRFNEIPFGVYREYTVSLAYDVAQTRQKHAFSDHSDLVARRMGFIPLPLGVVITRVLVHAVKIDG